MRHLRVNKVPSWLDYVASLSRCKYTWLSSCLLIVKEKGSCHTIKGANAFVTRFFRWSSDNVMRQNPMCISKSLDMIPWLDNREWAGSGAWKITPRESIKAVSTAFRKPEISLRSVYLEFNLFKNSMLLSLSLRFARLFKLPFMLSLGHWISSPSLLRWRWNSEMDTWESQILVLVLSGWAIGLHFPRQNRRAEL